MAKQILSSIKKSSATPRNAEITESERAIIESELGASLRKAATQFVVEMKSRFDPLDARSGTQVFSDAAHKFYSIKREYAKNGKNSSTFYEDPKIRNLFYAPSLFTANHWSALKVDERLQVISTGVKVAEPAIRERYRADFPSAQTHNTPTTIEEIPTAPESADQQNPEGRSEEGATTLVQSTPEQKFSDDYQFVYLPDQQPTADPTPRSSSFDWKILTTPIDRVPWRNQKISQGMAKLMHNISTLLDLLNLNVAEITATVSMMKCSISSLKQSLGDLTDENDKRCGDAVALLLSPLGNEPGGLGLSKTSVSKLAAYTVPPDYWCNQKHFLARDYTKEFIPIDNGWRLLRNYPSGLLADSELQELRNKFIRAGFPWK